MREPPDRVEKGRKGGLLSSVSDRNQQIGETGRQQVPDRGLGQPAQRFGVGGPVGERGDERIGDCGLRGEHGRTLTYFLVWKSAREHEIQESFAACDLAGVRRGPGEME